MRVLVLGATGNLGSRLLPALIAHGHQTVAFVRTASKVPATISHKLTAIVTGDAKSQADIETALLEHNCDAVVNTAGYAATAPWGKSDLPEIFQATLNAAVEVRRVRKKPLRAWLLGGFGMLDTPNPQYTIFDYIRVKPEHRINLDKLLKVPQSDLIWSYLCPAVMQPLTAAPSYPPDPKISADNMLVTARTPPEWSSKFYGVPLIGGYLNVLSQARNYTTSLEDNADFIAKDLEKGMASEWAYKKVGVREKK
ncbi:hypothetical protein V500_00939 [Pseudogymnoascus sp. VKM F-4518 (FW-2643)]|nr:hypothetical protein V500_00939 [Pseudogymnoascus sp. VKM F-4518 (FW-2643)]